MSGGCTIFDGAQSIFTIKNPGYSLRLIGLAFVCNFAFGDELAPEQSLPLIQFSIKPRLCVLIEKEDVCHDRLEINWSAAQPRSLCLYQSDKLEPLRCWKKATQGEYQFNLTASVSTDFQLREKQNQKPVSNQRFQVVFNDKKYRRQRRNPWSFF